MKIYPNNYALILFKFLLLCLISTSSYCQTVTQPASGTSSATITCGTTYTYFDPGGGGNYSNNQYSVYTLTPSVGGQFVQIDFSAGPFDIEPNGGGCYDFINIYDGTNTSAPLIGSYCNSNVPGIVTSSSGSLTIEFDSDGGTIGTGWAASVTCSATPGPFIHPSSGTNSTTIICGATYSYLDPGGTGNYGNNQLGTYTFNPSIGGSNVQIDFSAGPFDIEPNGGSCYDFIRIYDGPTTGSPLIGTYCNSNVPGLISATSGSLTVVFDTDGATIGSGWVATITCCAVSAGTASASPNSFCPAAGNTTLTLTGEDPAASIQWQVSTNGGTTWANIVGATTDNYVQAVAVNSMYRALVTNGCTSISSSTSVTVGCPDIIQPTTGTSSTTIQCGGSYKFYDSGNSGGNYTNVENGLITICPSAPGQYVSITINSFTLENNFDYLYVFDGNTGAADIIGVFTGTIGAGTVYKASTVNNSGCLSFRFVSDGATVAGGWDITVTCSGTPVAQYATSVSDCTGGVVVCGNGALNGGTSGPGYQELPGEWNTCLNFGGDGENQSNWYVFSPKTSGTIGFLISPNPAADYDWTIWGPYNSLECPAFTNDSYLRCSAASLATSGPNGETGLEAPAVDVLEASGGDGYLQPLNVIAGEIYILMLDNWNNNSNPFTLTWNLTNGATLECAPVLSVALASFNSECENSKALLKWTTGSEINNDYFIIEKSDAKFNFREIGKVYANGNSSSSISYSFLDEEINSELTYYRLVQVDFDGTVEYHPVIVNSNCQDYSFNVVQSNLNNGTLELLIGSSANESIVIQIYNTSGQLLTSETKEINSGNNNISLSNLNVNTGIYLVSIRGDYHSTSVKLFAK